MMPDSLKGAQLKVAAKLLSDEEVEDLERTQAAKKSKKKKAPPNMPVMPKETY